MRGGRVPDFRRSWGGPASMLPFAGHFRRR
jgi:hypothetical protein